MDNVKNDLVLDDKDKLILSKLNANPNLSIEDLSKILNVSYRTTQRYLTHLKENGFVKRIGSNKNGYWTIIK